MKFKQNNRSSSAAVGEGSADGRSSKKPNLRSCSSEELVEIAGESEMNQGDSIGLRLLGLLLRCAEAVAMDRLAEAQIILPEISELSSPYGSSLERVTAYFAEAIRARIVSARIGLNSSLSSASAASIPLLRKLILIQNQKIAQAFQIFNAISPFVKFAHFTANQAIFQALEGEESVHVIDLDIMQGLQWPGLFHILASRHGHKIRSIRITGVGSSPQLLQATGRRLSDFAAALGLTFHFHPLEIKIGNISDPSLFHLQAPDSKSEVTVVNWMQHCLYDVTGSDLGALRLLQALKPKLVVIVEQNLTHSGGFLERFVEALHYYSAMFDALGETSGEEERLAVEQQLLGTEIRNIVAVGGPKRTGEVTVERWSEKLKNAGFGMVNLAGGPATAQAELLLGMLPCKGYSLVEEDGQLKLGWKELSLLTASAWQP